VIAGCQRKPSFSGFIMPSPPKPTSAESPTLSASAPSFSTSQTSNPASTRLSQIQQHTGTMGSLAVHPVETLFNDNVVPQAPEDPLFGLMAAYRKDPSDKKVDLGIGAYRDNNAKPWVLPVVKKVRRYWRS
jgi:aspartate aminotransferase